MYYVGIDLGIPLTMGVCYYPEQWPVSLWETGLGRMKDAGISTVRVGEFAWGKFESTENVFTFDFLDGFLELTERMGMLVQRSGRESDLTVQQQNYPRR